ncbi:glutamate-5-semialdehyde dehydrogenase [Micromonospora peucetia]|uniref:glutamate-5-semialdehyde dehydrogenase n=1 Tax=Micromonospora peucetia TaxID=47871 RepID=UPI00332ADA30
MTSEITGPARSALADAPPPGDPAYQRYCRELAAQLRHAWPAIRKANAEDLASARRRRLPETLVDRLVMGDAQLAYLTALADAVHDALPAVTAPGPEIPIGAWGVRRQVPRPLGLVLMVYEARPTVTVEGALLPVSVGNAVLLRGGREIAATNVELGAACRQAAALAGLPPDLVTVLDDPTRATMRALLAQPDSVDVLVPRGSPSLIDYCRTATSIPVIASGGGVNHLYVDDSADLHSAAAIALDSKLPDPTACNALELVLVEESVAPRFVAALLDRAGRDGRSCVLRIPPELAPAGATPADPTGAVSVQPLEPHDLGREFLDPTIGVLAVTGVDQAIAHIRRHGSGHTEGIVSTDRPTVDRFVAGVDAATVVVNGSLRLHDGPTMGMGPELSISTGRLHVRGSVGLPALLTSSWLVQAHGALRDEVPTPAEAPRHPDPQMRGTADA